MPALALLRRSRRALDRRRGRRLVQPALAGAAAPPFAFLVGWATAQATVRRWFVAAVRGIMTVLRSAVFNFAFVAATALIGTAALPLLLAPRPAMRMVVSTWGHRAVPAAGDLQRAGRSAGDAAHPARPGGARLQASIGLRYRRLARVAAWTPSCPQEGAATDPGLGWHARSKMIPVDRSVRTGGQGDAPRREGGARRGRQIVIFPGGHPHRTGRARALSFGVVAIAGASHAPVIPATDSAAFLGPSRLPEAAGRDPHLRAAAAAAGPATRSLAALEERRSRPRPTGCSRRRNVERYCRRCG